MNETNFEFYWLIGTLVVFLLLIILIEFISLHNEFSSELRYLNMEIKRTRGDERRYYKWQRRRLWLSLLPFVKY